MKDGASSRALLLFIDQMEELFTSQDLTQANRFLASALSGRPREGALGDRHHSQRPPALLPSSSGHGEGAEQQRPLCARPRAAVHDAGHDPETRAGGRSHHDRDVRQAADS